MEERNSPMMVFISSFLISSLAGLATLLRTGDIINRKSVISSMLNSGILGLSIALIWFVKYQSNVYFLVGICILSGLGGNTFIDFIISRFKIKINTTLNIKEDSHADDKEHVSNNA